MSSPFGRLVLIADPSEEGGRIGEDLPRIEHKLQSMGLSHVLVRAGSEGERELAARDALLTGDRFVVAVGGDRTVHDVANGMLEDGRPVYPEAVLGVIAAGAASDFIKTFGLPSDVERACDHLQGDRLFPIDAGTVVATSGPANVKRSFVNIAEVGLGASIVRRTARLPEGLGRARRFLGFWLGLAVFRPAHVRLGGDRRTWEGKAHDVLVANCQYQGGGMRISPRSWPDDGYLDILVMKGPRSDAFTMLPKTYLGEHLPHPNIVEYRARTLRVEASRALWIHADGEMVGTTPATFEVVPKAIRLKI
ncbi:MAG TPA: diacylglycerol kinase family protein [Actinomycetota bacterium]|nr:diacylglycerol kinase family protein [Actinomycetota bacterium]